MAAATSKMERFVITLAAVNYSHKALHLGCCSSHISASDSFFRSEDDAKFSGKAL